MSEISTRQCFSLFGAPVTLISTIISAASFPIRLAGKRTVVSPGSMSRDPLKSPIPPTERSSGIRSPRDCAANMTPWAIISLPQTIAVGGLSANICMVSFFDSPISYGQFQTRFSGMVIPAIFAVCRAPSLRSLARSLCWVSGNMKQMSECPRLMRWLVINSAA